MSKLFVNLHAHSFFSIADSICSPEEMVKKAKELGMTALAISDHGTLGGWLQFRNACKKYGIKPIFGVESYFVDDVNEIHAVNANISALRDEIKVLNKDKTTDGKILATSKQEALLQVGEHRNKLRKYNHLILLAKNYKGYQSLIKIHNSAVLDGIYYKPRISWETLEKYIIEDSVIASSACLGGRLCKLLAQDAIEEAKDAVGRFKRIFGPNNFYIELQLHDIPLQTETNIKLIKLAEATDTPCVVTCDSHYVDEGEHTTRGLIRQLDKEPDEQDNDTQLTDLYIKNEDMLLKSWNKYMPGQPKQILVDAILNTRRITDTIEEYPFDTALKFPLFDTGELNQEDYLTKNAWSGLKNKGLEQNLEYVERLKFELKTVNILGFASYFNVVGDLVREAKRTQSVGAGRGSGSGSLLGYVLGITEVDPLKYNLFFERFLDSSRGVVAPTFGQSLEKIEIDYEAITACCEHHNH